MPQITIADTLSDKHDGYPAAQNEDLGYYHDGTQRTLTDEQIAMFRHSEIYSIIRARQVRKENEDAELSEATQRTGEDDVFDMPAVSNVPSGAHGRPMMHQEKQLTGGHKRQKTNHFNDDAQSRRSVRELDAAVADSEELDYGAEPQESLESSAPINEQSASSKPTEIRSEGRKIWWPLIEG